MSSKLNYLDLFAGAGGLSEGFVRAGFTPIAHVEMEAAACYTLRTRAVYHWLKEKGQLAQYADYLKGDISRKEFYDSGPDEVTQSVINAEIGRKTLPDIFNQIDSLLGSQKIDLIIGGPPCQAYSVMGRARCPNKMKGDPRNELYIFYAEFLKRYQPKYFVFENVPGAAIRDKRRWGILFKAYAKPIPEAIVCRMRRNDRDDFMRRVTESRKIEKELFLAERTRRQ